jgi:hypothetical protein
MNLRKEFIQRLAAADRASQRHQGRQGDLGRRGTAYRAADIRELLSEVEHALQVVLRTA